MSVPQHIAGLLEDYLDATLDEPGHQALTVWTGESDANCQALAAWFLTQAQLLDASRLADMQAVFQRMTFDTRPETTALRSMQPVRSARTTAQSWLLIAASVLVALGLAYIWPRPANKRNLDSPIASAGAQSTPNRSPSPAMLGRLGECVWENGVKPLRVGQDLAAGTLVNIKSGLAQLVFESGAEVVLEGPCRLRVDNSMLCQLFSGNVSAEVPHRAAGFTIRGPSAEVIDLGTRFGFSVGAAGNSEVHVFQGEVISRQLDEHGDVVGKEFRLKKNQAVLFPGEKKQAQRLAANEAKFAVEVKPLWKQDKIEPLVIDRNVALWLRAAHGVQTDKSNRVIAWQDLALGSNHISNDAFQPNPKARPLYVLDGLHGRPAIRFDGAAAYLTTTPISTTNDQTIVVVFQYAPEEPGAARIAGQIVNYNGPPSRYLPDVRSPGVLQLGEKIDSSSGPVASIAAKAFVGRDSRGADISAGIVVSKSLGYSHPRVAAYVYNNTDNSSSLYVDGNPVAESSAPTRVAVASRKVIGKHGIFDQWYFHGDLSELVIFNTALRPSEVEELSRQLMEHYAISRQNEST
jgi:concanavalin A-like lectin/glucanase superfamily protein